jgi:hypothetical protein
MITSALEYSKNFLKRKGIQFDELHNFVPGIEPEDVLILIGSVPDGLANSLSDVDILHIGSHNSAADLVLHEGDCARIIKRVSSDLEINVEFWSRESICGLSEKLDQIGETLSRPNEIKDIVVLDEEQIRIIHYILNGAPIFGNINIIRSMFKEQYFACLEDCLGQIIDSDTDTAALCLRYATEYLISSELASLHQSSPYGKWRIRLLKRCDEMIDEDLINNYLRFLFPQLQMEVHDIENAISFFGERIGEILKRRNSIVPAVAALGARMQFVTSLQSALQVDR